MFCENIWKIFRIRGFECSAQVVLRNLTHKGFLYAVNVGHTRMLERIQKKWQVMFLNALKNVAFVGFACNEF